MCGFVAILGRSDEGELQRMAQAVAVRGPDDRGECALPPFQAIHHRLSIIGPDPRGRQPMTVGDITVLFNGCIYNYPQLRQQLEQDGVVFTSATDTEVLPHLFQRHGTEMFAMLNGMFSIVLWHTASGQLTIARDGCGEKPLFICQQSGRIGIASTLTAFEHGEWTLSPNVEAAGRLLVTMRIEAPVTLYREVQQLPAGCWAQCKPGEMLQSTRFYRLPPPDGDPTLCRKLPSIQRLAQEVEQRIDAAFSLRLLSDRPLGLFLSGGVDSSLLAASLAETGNARLHTFAVRFAGAGADYDETPFAAQVAHHLGTDHQTLVVRPDADATLDAMATAFDQPVTNASALPTFLISQAAKEYVDVALSGIGGDELFGGYPRYLGLAWHSRLQHLPGQRLALSLLSRLGDSSSSRNLRGRLRRLLLGLQQTPADAYRQWTATSDAALGAIISQPLEAGHHAWPSAVNDHGGLEHLLASYGMVNGAMAYDQLSYLTDDLLPVADRMSMAHGLELRSPFLDPDLIHYALQLDARFKVAGMPWREGLKILLKEVACRRLPRAVVHRPKQGFMAPVKLWLRHELRTAVEELASRSPVGGLVRQSFVQQQWQRHLAGEDCSDMLWGILLLDRWAAQRGWQF
ncbi:MAG: asparagine synthase (glutamine-hydrolyzing) [Mariprofundales bacterium]